MLQLNIFSLGQHKNKDLEKLEQEYLKRLSANYKIVRKEFKTNDKLLAEFKQRTYYKIGLLEKGKLYNSFVFSAWLQKTLETQSQLCFVIADAEGFSPEVENVLDFKLSLSSLTFPHELARLILCEQLYRAMTILKHHPYHK